MTTTKADPAADGRDAVGPVEPGIPTGEPAVSTGTRREQAFAARRAGTRQQIIDAAVNLIADQGFTATSVEDIAAAAGVAKGSVYYNFGSKSDVFEAALAGGLERLTLTLEAAREGSTARPRSVRSSRRCSSRSAPIRTSRSSSPRRSSGWGASGRRPSGTSAPRSSSSTRPRCASNGPGGRVAARRVGVRGDARRGARMARVPARARVRRGAGRGAGADDRFVRSARRQGAR
ncbi:TetR family transcriptional regulator [Oerskovia sp. M15]